MSTHFANLNADLGESFGAWSMGDDAAMLSVIDSANIACGFHAGDPLVLRDALARAREAGVEVGAHPSYPDLQGFGRRSMKLGAEELTACLHYQLAAFAGMARTQGLRMAHVKPHGALNNDACADRALADVVAAAIRAFDPEAILLAPALSPLAAAGRAAGLRVADEIFADRAYAEDGSLAKRGTPGAMIHDASAALSHALTMLREGALVTLSGRRLPAPIASICVHGDGPAAVATARALREALAKQGFGRKPLAALV